MPLAVYFLDHVTLGGARISDLQFKELSDNIVLIKLEGALEAFRKGAIRFLATRIAGTRNLSNPPPPEDPSLATLQMRQSVNGPHIGVTGCIFSVSTNTHGLRVFWSGAYYISANYFGHPTSPTTTVLQSGTYVFGVDGGAYGNVVQWDKKAICSLPGKSSVHLNK